MNIKKIIYIYGKPYRFFPSNINDLKDLWKYIRGYYTSIYYTQENGLCGMRIYNKFYEFLRKLLNKYHILFGLFDKKFSKKEIEELNEELGERFRGKKGGL